VLPWVRARLARRLRIEDRPAWPELAIPTVIVVGTTITLFAAEPTVKDLAHAAERGLVTAR
jgi:hypothetical protein